MRKFTGGVMLDPDTFEPRLTVRVIDDGSMTATPGYVLKLIEKTFTMAENIEQDKYYRFHNKYKIPGVRIGDDYDTLRLIDEELEKRKLPEMTEEEMAYFLDPGGVKRKAEKTTVEDVSELAGVGKKYKLEQMKKQAEKLEREIAQLEGSDLQKSEDV